MGSENEKDDDRPSWKHLKVEHVFPEGQRVQFVNHITVQHTDEGEFIISFYEIFTPVFLGPEDEIKQQITGMGSIPANCIGRFSIAAARMPKVISALITNYDQYEADTGKATPAIDNDSKSQKHAS